MERQVEAMLSGRQFRRSLENYLKGLCDKYGIKRVEAEVLYYLSHAGDDNTAKDIAKSLFMNKGHISQTTDSLKKKGLIETEKDAMDYRIVHYSVTDEAKPLMNEVDDAIDRLYEMLLDGLDEDDRDALARIAASVGSNIRGFID